MNIDNFEEEAKNLFENDRIEADTDLVWQNIEPKLKKKKKRRGLLLFFFGLLLLGWGLLPHTKKHKAAIAQKALAAQTADSLARAGNTSVPTTEPIANDKTVALAIAASNGNALAPNQAASTQSSLQNQPASTHSVAPKGAKHPLAAAMTPQNQVGETQTPPQNTSSPNKAQTPEQDNSGTVIAAQTSPTADAMPAQTTAPLTAIDTTKASDGNPSKTQHAQASKKEAVPSVDTKEEEDEKTKSAKKKRRRTTPPKHQWSIVGGPTLALQLLQRRGSFGRPLLEKRRESESALEAFHLGVLYGLCTKGDLIFKVGLLYRRDNRKFEVSYNEVETSTKIGVIEQVQDASGQIIEQTNGLKEITRTTTYLNRKYNRTSSVFLPIGLGFQRAHKKNILEWSGGVNIPLRYRFEGTVFNRDLIPTKLQYEQGTYKNMFKNRGGLGLWGTYSWARHWKKNTYWQIGTNVNLPVSSVTISNYPLKQWGFHFDLQAGVTFRL